MPLSTQKRIKLRIVVSYHFFLVAREIVPLFLLFMIFLRENPLLQLWDESRILKIEKFVTKNTHHSNEKLYFCGEKFQVGDSTNYQGRVCYH